MTQGLRPIRRALLSVYDKTGLVDFARALHGRGIPDTDGPVVARREEAAAVGAEGHSNHVGVVAA